METNPYHPTNEKKTMHIRLVKSDKKRFLDLLLLADEQESMIDRYIERGDLFVMEEKGEAKAVAVVTREGQGVYELKNLAVAPACQRKGNGRMMVEHVWHYYADCHTLLVGTGNSPLTLPFTVVADLPIHTPCPISSPGTMTIPS